MKKIIVLVCFSLLLLTGCSSEVKNMTCTRTLNQDGMAVDLKYEVEYANDVVKRVKSTEKITSETPELLKTYKTNIEATYSPYKDIEHYNYDVTIDGNVLTSSTEIDYEKIDTDKMIEIDSANGQLIKDGKIRIEDLTSAYEALGATCEK